MGDVLVSSETTGPFDQRKGAEKDERPRPIRQHRKDRLPIDPGGGSRADTRRRKRARQLQLLASGSLKSNVFLLDMNLLFERFVQKLLVFSLGTGYQIEYQTRTRSILWDINRNGTYGTVIPDFMLTEADDDGRLIIDAKYKST
jgi:McrBC 5-methylcytosine restriction system component